MTTVTVIRLSKSPSASRVVSSTTMPRSLATIGAETMLTSPSIGRSSPASAAEVSALMFICATCALVGDLHLGDAGLGQLAGERAELLGERDEGLQLRRLLGGDRGEVERVGDRAAAADSPTSARRPAARRSPAPRWWRRRDAACRPRWDGRTAGSASPAPRRTRRTRRRRRGRDRAPRAAPPRRPGRRARS